MLTLLLLLTLPQSVLSAPTPSTSLSVKTSTEKDLMSTQPSEMSKSLLQEEMQATQASACNSLEPPFLKTEDKIVLAPIVFQGKSKIHETILLHNNIQISCFIKIQKLMKEFWWIFLCYSLFAFF